MPELIQEKIKWDRKKLFTTWFDSEVCDTPQLLKSRLELLNDNGII